MLAIGTQAPDFTLPDQNGEMKSLEDFRGQKVILYFYPKDMTAGCTKQACAFGELYPQFREKGAVVLGVSKDTVASHKRFEEKYGLPFTLLSDTEKTVIQAYDVWKEKKLYGKVSMGLVRTTYLIDENGHIGAHEVDGGYAPIPIGKLFIGDKKLGGFEEPDSNTIEWSFFPNWSDKLVKVEPTDYNPLTDLANVASA